MRHWSIFGPDAWERSDKKAEVVIHSRKATQLWNTPCDGMHYLKMTVKEACWNSSQQTWWSLSPIWWLLSPEWSIPQNALYLSRGLLEKAKLLSRSSVPSKCTWVNHSSKMRSIPFLKYNRSSRYHPLISISTCTRPVGRLSLSLDIFGDQNNQVICWR